MSGIFNGQDGAAPEGCDFDDVFCRVEKGLEDGSIKAE